MHVGLKRGTVKLASRHRAWRRLFLAERRALKRAFGKTILGIEHIGSTAIPGVPAKPIIDIAVGVTSLLVAKRMKRTFTRLGYEYRGKRGVSGREFFVRGPEERRTHYVHVVVYGGRQWQRLVGFRDALRTDRKAALRYTLLKRTLAKRFAQNRPAYTRGKAKLIAGALKRWAVNHDAH